MTVLPASPNPRLTAALGYAARGWHVVLLVPRGKKPLVRKEDGGRGVHDATTDPEKIREWWTKYPDANIGIACGPDSGIVGVDMDLDHGGADALAKLEAEHGPLPGTPWVCTGSGGAHFYFAHPDEEVPNWDNLAPGVEVKALGKYLVAPPSVHPNGKPYAWGAGGACCPDLVRLAPLPAWLIKPHCKLATSVPSTALLKRDGGCAGIASRYFEAAFRDECGLVASAPAGRRNNVLNIAALKLGHFIPYGHLAREDVERGLLEASQANGYIAEHGENAALRTIASGIEAGTRNPFGERLAALHLMNGTPRTSAGPAPAPGGATPSSAAAKGIPGAVFHIEYLDLDKARENGIPPISWLLEGWLVDGDIAVLAGPGGIGKSTAAAYMAVALAAGRPWCGIVPAEAVPVLYFDEEQGAPEVTRLFNRLIAGMGLDAAPAGLHVASGQGISLNASGWIERVGQDIKAHGARVVFLDSVQQGFGGVDENNAQEVGMVFRNLFQLREAHGVTFVLIHHRRKPQPGARTEALDLVRGSTAFTTQASTVWSAASAGPTAMELVQAKRRGGTKTSMRLVYSAPTDDGPITLTSEGPVALAETAQAKAEVVFAEYLADRTEATTQQLEEVAMTAGITLATARRALKQLKQLRTVVQPGRGRWRLSIGSTQVPTEGGEQLL